MKSSLSINDKRKYEKEIADFFILHLNIKNGLYYRTKINQNEDVLDTDTDVYAEADNCETLNLQIKTGEPELEGFWGSRKKYGSGWVSIDNDILKLLSSIINEAEKKYSNKKDLILLIGERMQPIFSKKDKDFLSFISKPHQNSPFKGIYIVKLSSGNKKDTLYSGQVVSIKDIYGDSGIVF